MVNFGPLAADIVSLVWDTPGNFNGVSRLGSVTVRYSSSTGVTGRRAYTTTNARPTTEHAETARRH